MALEAKVKLTLEDKVKRKLDQIFKEIHGIDAETYKMVNNTTKASAKLKQMISHAKNLQGEFKKNNTLLDSFGKKLKSIFAAYGGVMAIKAVVQTSDTITSAENKLNYINGGNTNATQEQMDKMYAASLRSHSDYADMMSNISKSMTIAPDAFLGNMDNAIKFQELMAKTYTLAGASQAEQSQSMYQLIQALGADKLQGDELKSVMENAPLAYDTIQSYVQGILAANGQIEDSKKSLQELGSEGKVTGQMIVAAIFNAEESIESAFADADLTIGMVATDIKSTMMNSFRSVQDTINDFLNSETGAKFIEGVTIALQGLIGILNRLLTVAVIVITWIVDNWDWLQYIVYGIATAIIFLAVVAIGQKLFNAILLIFTANPFIWWAISIGIVIACIVWLANTAADGCDFIYNVCQILVTGILGLMAIVLAVYLATGALMLSVPMLIVLAIIAVVALLVMAIAKYGEQIGAAIAAVVSYVWNCFVTLVATIIQCALMPFAKAWDTVANFFGNIFNDPIATIIHMFETLAKSVLGILKTIASGIDAIFGSNLAGTVQGWMDKVSGKADSLANKYGNGTYETKSDAVGALNDLMSGAVDKYTWDTSLAIQQGAAVGAGAQNWINSTFDKAKNGLSSLKSSITDKIDKGLDIDRNFDPNSSQYDLNTDKYNPDKLIKGVGNIDKNTGKMADSMELTDEDLKYLRDLAEREWKKEFTTANIVVDMNNYNTIDSDNDLDGIITKLNSKLYDELDYLANGTYGYAYGHG